MSLQAGADRGAAPSVTAQRWTGSVCTA